MVIFDDAVSDGVPGVQPAGQPVTDTHDLLQHQVSSKFIIRFACFIVCIYNIKWHTAYWKDGILIYVFLA